jgi:hypothetical protein
MVRPRWCYVAISADAPTWNHLSLDKAFDRFHRGRGNRAVAPTRPYLYWGLRPRGFCVNAVRTCRNAYFSSGFSPPERIRGRQQWLRLISAA